MGMDAKKRVAGAGSYSLYNGGSPKANGRREVGENSIREEQLMQIFLTCDDQIFLLFGGLVLSRVLRTQSVIDVRFIWQEM